jgi:hypothetical protein
MKKRHEMKLGSQNYAVIIKKFMKIYQLIQKLLVKDTDSIVILYASLSFLREVS